MKHLLSKHIRTLLRLLVALPAMLTLTGCVNDYGNCVDPGSDPDPVKLRFTIVTRALPGSGTGQTRATDAYEEQAGTASENYLNIAGRDIRFLLFDDEKKLLRDFTPDVDITPSDASNYVTYTVRATIAEPYFARVAEQETTGFYIMVIANGRPYRLGAFGLATGATTINDVADQLAYFTMPTLTEWPDGSRTGWRPSAPGNASGEYIPMSGLQYFSLPKGAFDTNGPESFVDLSSENVGKDINMLRAIAKIEVVDKIDILDKFPGDRNIELEKAELFGYCATGTILPSYGEWNRDVVHPETQQVRRPTMAKQLDYHAPNGNIEEPVTWAAEIDFFKDEVAQQAREDGCPVFSVYVPEYSREDIGTSVRPYIRVTVQDPDNPNQYSKLYKLQLASYTDGVAGEDIEALLRNHIYRYEITAVGSIVNIGYTLCPWDTGKSLDVPGFN